MEDPTYFYICDGKACPVGCASGSMCKHTKDVNHAKYTEHDWDNAEAMFNGKIIIEREKKG